MRRPASLRVSVRDNGVGIPEDQLKRIFNVFVSSKGQRGTGLGLPVSQKILQEHGGQILVESQPGRGSCFILEWPALAVEATATLPAVDREQRTRSDDNRPRRCDAAASRCRIGHVKIG